LAQRSRKRGQRQRRRPAATATATAPRPRPTAEERNAAVRATLTPIAPGERPWALRIAVAVALLVAVSNIVQAVIGADVKVAGSHTTLAGSLLFAAIMFVCAAGMWRLQYWALLGFQALLGLVIIAFVLVAVTANDLVRLLIALAIIGSGGFLFFKLVRVLSRLQMPRPPGG
jgi:hypothetical protein